MRNPILSINMKRLSYTTESLTNDINRISPKQYSATYISLVLAGTELPSMTLSILIMRLLGITQHSVDKLFALNSTGASANGISDEARRAQRLANAHRIRHSYASNLR